MNKIAATPAQGKMRSAFKLNPVAAGCAVFVSAMASSAFAQEAAPAPDVPAATIQTVTVSGIRRGIEAAIETKKNATSIVETISAEDIGKLPDTTIAESLARLPGLTAQRTKSGTASNISIRGLGPDFNGYLLNGREQTSTGDSRSVDLSAYPAELIGSATVYKTSDASLMAAGLAGTIDQRLIDPLAFPGRKISVSYEKIRNGVGLEVQGRGNRTSLSYVDQFADRKIGIALGFVRVDGNSSSVEKGNWGDATVAATGPSGNSLGNVKVPGFGGGISQQTNDTTDKRTGVAAILAFRPNTSFNTQLDLFYSKMDIATKKNAVKVGLGGPITNATVAGGVATAGTFALGASPGGMINYIENVFDLDELKSLGWKSNLKLSDTWRVSADVSHNTATRVERDIEFYAGIAGADTLSFVTNGDDTKFTLGNPTAYTNPATMQIRDQTGWSGINGVPQAGYSKGPTIKDKVDAVRFDLKHDLPDGMMFSNVEFGANYTKRSKDRITDEGLIVSTTNGGHDRIAFPTDTSVYSNVGGTGLDMLTFSPQADLVPGATILRKYNNDILSKTWSVQEKISTAYGKLNIDTQAYGVDFTGNFGLQVVHTNQSSDGFRAGVGSDVVLTNPSVGGALTRDGITYTDVLPSMNLVSNFGEGRYLKLGVSQQIARPTLTDMRNSFAASIDTNPANVNTFGHFTGSAGNVALKPFKAKAFDLSAEKYFGKRGYVSGAVFYKKLDSYITTATDTKYDYTQVATALGLQIPAAGPIGTYTTSVNGNGGSLRGYEVTASAPFDMVVPMLTGFGASGSYSATASSVNLPDLTGLNPTQPVPAGGTSMPLPGLSKKNAKATVYYERNGFSFFVAKNYRSTYVAGVANDAIGGYPTLRYVEGSSWISAQIGYEFQTGMFKGLGIRVEGNNLNSPVYRQLRADGSEQSSTKTGRTIMFKASYKM
jgi:iron complex outermembrane receptor protein